MRVIIAVILAVFLFTLTAHSDLTPKDLDAIQQIVQKTIQDEVALIQKEIVETELRIKEKIRESENRLQVQFSQSLDNRTNGIMIIFGVISMGFFLLFATTLFVGAIRNRQVDKQAIILMVLSLAGVLISQAPLNADRHDTPYQHIVCTGLTIIDKDDDPRIELTAEPFPNISLYGFVRDKLIDIEAGLFGGHITLKSSQHKVTDPKERTRIRLSTHPGMTSINMGESSQARNPKGISLGTVYSLQSISVTGTRGEHSIYPEY